MCSLQRVEAVGGDPVGEQGRGSRRPGRRRSARPATCPRWSSSCGGATDLDERLGAGRSRRAPLPASGRARDRACAIRPAARAGSTSTPASAVVASIGKRARGLAPRDSSSQASPISVARNASSTASASGRRAATTRPAMLDARCRPAGATSAQTSRERMRPPPALAALLAGDGDEAEIADRGAVRLRVAVDHDDPAARAGRPPARGRARQMPAPTTARSKRPALRSPRAPGLRAGEAALR